MKTDRELLELSAKAAGISTEWHPGCGNAVALTQEEARSMGRIFWNPLTDDGDALRLAVKLSIDVFNKADREGNVGARISIAAPWLIENESNDKYAAVRRAIVRAAAAIGEAMS